MPASGIRDVDTIHDIFLNQSQKLVDHSHHVTNNLLKASTNSNITFVIGGKVFNAHHIILAAQCEYITRYAVAIAVTINDDPQWRHCCSRGFHLLH